ncbi:MAG: hypothetical protein FH758_08345 [Firmicutes bacterium]|nr:hypothetical protein [Bacillota bacterium]
MKKKLIIIGTCILLALSVIACSEGQPNGEKSEALNGEEHTVKYEYTDEGIIKPEIAEEVIKETSDKVINAIKEKDMGTVSSFVHPDKGVRFTPYTHVSLDDDIVFSKKQIQNFFKDEEKYIWGHYDGKGNEIKLTPSEYYEEFIYTADFVNAEEVGYNTILSSGNMLENQFEVYENSIVVEYYFSGDYEYQGMDWESLRLVYEEYEGTWFLVGIIHNQWTI